MNPIDKYLISINSTTNQKSGCPYCMGKKTLNYDLFK